LATHDVDLEDMLHESFGTRSREPLQKDRSAKSALEEPCQSHTGRATELEDFKHKNYTTAKVPLLQILRSCSGGDECKQAGRLGSGLHVEVNSCCVPQDPQRRKYLGLLSRLQPHYTGPVSLHDIDKTKAVFSTFTNAAPVYVEQLLNWAYHLRELGLPHLVVCLDSESEEIASSNGIPWVPVQNKTTSEDVRNDHATFRAMVSRKVRGGWITISSRPSYIQQHESSF
jgi:hypothetical protein